MSIKKKILFHSPEAHFQILKPSIYNQNYKLFPTKEKNKQTKTQGKEDKTKTGTQNITLHHKKELWDQIGEDKVIITH